MGKKKYKKGIKSLEKEIAIHQKIKLNYCQEKKELKLKNN